MATVSLGPTPTCSTQLARRIRLLVAATITYNVIEAIAAVTVKEGREAWRGDNCCAVPVGGIAETTGQEQDGCGCAPGCACCAPATEEGDAR
ncbi:hypothetical protein [Streptomyces sp. SID9913]|uniref:hypothetical protein n=1 Tax=Streptomyces sp. SID9913 TaxID=2706117 RepID=UPI001EF1CEF8|nr:hypothetical protein [Streptomyces sp. SID9913]